VIDTLESNGVLDHTLVVFTSDNGFFLGEQRRRQGKILPYEPSIRVPLLMRGPGIPKGLTRSDPFTSIDYAPTLATAAGVSIPQSVDGTSLLGVARNGDTGWTRAILTETGPVGNLPTRDTDIAGNPLQPGEAADPRAIIGIRTSRYLYTDWATGEEELYDLRTDPQEYDNLVDDPGHADTLNELRQVLHTMRACQGGACRAPLPADLVQGP
jgi:arylsulfatase A-like enzyme